MRGAQPDQGDEHQAGTEDQQPHVTVPPRHPHGDGEGNQDQRGLHGDTGARPRVEDLVGEVPDNDAELAAIGEAYFRGPAATTTTSSTSPSLAA